MSSGLKEKLLPKRPHSTFKLLGLEVFQRGSVLNTSGRRLQICHPPVLQTTPYARWVALSHEKLKQREKLYFFKDFGWVSFLTYIKVLIFYKFIYFHFHSFFGCVVVSIIHRILFSIKMGSELWRTFYPWCSCIKTCCLSYVWSRVSKNQPRQLQSLSFQSLFILHFWHDETE